MNSHLPFCGGISSSVQMRGVFWTLQLSSQSPAEFFQTWRCPWTSVHKECRRDWVVCSWKRKIRCFENQSLHSRKFHQLKNQCSQSTLDSVGRKLTGSYARDDNVLLDLSTDEVQEGPIELPPEVDLFAIPEANPLQLVASFFLTGAIAVLLVRNVRKRAQRAKETKFRSTGEEAAVSIVKEATNAVAVATEAPQSKELQPSAAQTFFGGVFAGILALLMYKFATLVEASFVGKAVSDNYSIRNLTITVRTIVNGVCYLATFVFAANSVGLILYSLQLAFNTLPPSPRSSTELESTEYQDLPSIEKKESISEIRSSDGVEK